MLSPAAQQVIQNFLSLPFKNQTGVNAPYFINKGNRVRGALRVLVGKGNPEDITEEAMIISLRDKLDLSKMSAEEMKQFLVNNHIGTDCSAFVYYILNAESQARGKGKLSGHLHYPHIKNPVRKLFLKLRPVENTNVKVFALPENSTEVSLSDVQPGDIITMLGSGKEHDRDHVLLVHEVEKENTTPKVIHYTHSLQWRTDGKYNHGVRQGKIIITDIQKPLTEQRWIEQEKEGDENETLERARFAQKLSIRRLHALS